jgi:hypothetical protein
MGTIFLNSTAYVAICGVFMKITVRSVATQKQNVNFLENGLTDFDYILIIYTGNGPK